MRKHGKKILIASIFCIGLLVFLYPVVGNILNTLKNNYDIAHYQAAVKEVPENTYDAMFEKARNINKALGGVETKLDPESDFYKNYQEALCLSGGMMGALSIDKIGVNLAIYHGTSEDVLQDGIGYLEGTDLPTGDIGNSTVLTGHTGLPSATLLTDLDQLTIGDTFEVSVLDRTFTYEVFEKNVVLPYEVESLARREDIDMVTLVTCTPYGVNTHRLLVHGKQIDPPEESADAPQADLHAERDWASWKTWMPFVMIGTVLVLLACIALRARATRYRPKH